MSRKKAEWHGCRECGCKHNGECDETEKDAFVNGAMWAYQELTGALIVPASFEQAARALAEINNNEGGGK